MYQRFGTMTHHNPNLDIDFHIDLEYSKRARRGLEEGLERARRGECSRFGNTLTELETSRTLSFYLKTDQRTAEPWKIRNPNMFIPPALRTLDRSGLLWSMDHSEARYFYGLKTDFSKFLGHSCHNINLCRLFAHR